MWFKSFGRPDFDLGNDDKIEEADRTVNDIEHKKRELQARLDLLQIRGMPRGEMNG